MDIRVEITIFIGAASPLLLLVRQTWNVITKRGLAVEMGLTKREESELRFGWPARVSRPIAFLFTAFYHATGLKRCNNSYESVMLLTTESAIVGKNEAARNMSREGRPRSGVEIDLR